MISSLYIKNFKALGDHSLTFKPLTLISGLNSTGKSSVLQSILTLRQSYQQKLLPGEGLALNGDLVSIGRGKDARFEDATEDLIEIKLTDSLGMDCSWQFKCDNQENDSDVLPIISQEAESLEIYESSSVFNENFHYLQAERIGPRSSFKMSNFQVAQLKSIGTQGEYTGHFLSINERNKICNVKLSHPTVKQDEDNLGVITPSLDLIDQVEAWLGEISPGIRLRLDQKPDLDLMSIRYQYGDSDRYRSTNVGFGITYSLPIIVAILSSKPGALVIIENPEAHLHPQGQAKMGELLALAASCGIQIVVETHSDHVLNGIRVAVHSKRIAPDDVQLYYFQRANKSQQYIIETIALKIDRNGRIDRWPDGFFDQFEKNLGTLLEKVED
jgi:predicted ATPase